ncbi:undecaprenyldiphospho-muramoylpentapeptide beta-N-acetylglucosaminyltransferase [Pseudoramibacter faecis]|uniref:undecaprenyldiphospho-muramoylpentapeptide beta-N-acetylglucosaminyltransferase n=1 Tax=Pseudoramibacter faecis TaxID=3108534 RepID=UPI002E78756B|nr:undecaprenyldiphospho-muramoylpentapeptide beta-N-acetylglucosaminyltransferase [Pseudoramibacter sp. HA2172]
MKSVLIAAGGTGGHIYPGLAIAACLKKHRPDVEITFVGSHVGMEKDIVPRYGYPMAFINASGFQRGLIKKAIAVKNILLSALDSRRLIKAYQPQLVIGTGGFTSGILLREAARMKVPTLIHEQNAYPGKSNRMAAKTADCVALTFEEAAAYFPAGKTVLCGNPVRDDFKHIDRQVMRERLGLADDTVMVLAMGGSQGAVAINGAMRAVMAHYAGRPQVQLYQLTGKKQWEAMTRALDADHIPWGDGTNCHLLAYSNEMPTLIGAADLIIGRSGASSIAEMAASGTPCILIPYPYAAGDHQKFNAVAMARAGAAVVIEEKDLSGERLIAAAETLIGDADKRQAMAQKALAYAKLDADERIVEKALALMGE